MKMVRLYRLILPLLAGLMVAALPLPPQGSSSIEALENRASHAPVSAGTIHRILPDADVQRYREIRALQRRSLWQEADAVITTLHGRQLLGHVLAARYLDRRYSATISELTTWLEAYADHPQSSEIRALALRKGAQERGLPRVETRSPLRGYGDDNGLASRSYRPALLDESAWAGRAEAKALWGHIEGLVAISDTGRAMDALQSAEADLLTSAEADILRWELAEQLLYGGDAQAARALMQPASSNSGAAMPAMHWVSGLSAWKLGHISEAAGHFAAMADSGVLSAWEESKGAFWAYRAYSRLGSNVQAQQYLRKAAEAPRTFYGVLARRALGMPVFSAASAEIADSDTLARLTGRQAVQRAAALAQIGEVDTAEKELRLLFPQLANDERAALLVIAERIGLPALQVAMAHALVKQGVPAERFLYPTPAWEPYAGFDVDPALVFALARQESGFRASALGAGGALGVMQLMPKTATLMRKSFQRDSDMRMDSMIEPEANITLGQHYLQHLMETPIVEDNLFYLIASYNAGPGKVQAWKRRPHAANDPLLFLELTPYPVTRHYVTQVMTNYWIYQALRGDSPVTATALLKGKWPRYHAPAAAVSAR